MPCVNKWIVLALGCIVTFGGYYSFDTPSALHNQIFRHFKDAKMDASDFEFDFSLVYSVYSLPNTFVPFFGGMMIDRFGNVFVMLLFGFFILFGNTIETISYFTCSMKGFIIGRFIFGLGAETLGVSVSTIISKWFVGQETAFALAVNLSISKLASVLTDWISPEVSNHYDVRLNSVIVTVLCALCFLFTIILAFIEADESYLSASLLETNEKHHPKFDGRGGESTHEMKRSGESDETMGLLEENKVSSNYDYESINSIEAKENSKISVEMEKHSEISEKKERLSFLVWLLFIFTFIMYGTFMPFNNLSNAILLELYFPYSGAKGKILKEQEIMAGWLQSIPNFLSVFLTPIIGLGIDFFGHRTALFLFSSILLLFAHVFILLGIFDAKVPLAMIGVSYSIFGSVIWACVPVVVPEALHGTAYGIMVAFQNSGQFLVPLVLQYLARVHHTYLACEVFFIYFSLLATCNTLLLWVVDETQNGGALRVFKLIEDAKKPDKPGKDGIHIQIPDYVERTKIEPTSPITIIPIPHDNKTPINPLAQYNFPVSDPNEFRRQILARSLSGSPKSTSVPAQTQWTFGGLVPQEGVTRPVQKKEPRTFLTSEHKKFPKVPVSVREHHGIT